ncbi:superinfection exclusion B family protein [Ferrimonas marina]|nr:superinfection exclusion B family protein [Ferrimonas marina]
MKPSVHTMIASIPFALLAARIALWLLIAASALLLLPLANLQSLHLQEWVGRNGFSLGLTVVLSGSYLLAHGLMLGVSGLTQKQQRKLAEQRLQQKLQLLDGQERAVLREYLLQSKSTLAMPLTHPTVNELMQSGVLVQAGATEHYAIEGPVAPLKIANGAKARLTRQLLRLPEGQLDEQQKAALMASRPEFMAGKRSRRQAA